MLLYLCHAYTTRENATIEKLKYEKMKPLRGYDDSLKSLFPLTNPSGFRVLTLFTKA